MMMADFFLQQKSSFFNQYKKVEDTHRRLSTAIFLTRIFFLKNIDFFGITASYILLIINQFNNQ